MDRFGDSGEHGAGKFRLPAPCSLLAYAGFILSADINKRSQRAGTPSSECNILREGAFDRDYSVESSGGIVVRGTGAAPLSFFV